MSERTGSVDHEQIAEDFLRRIGAGAAPDALELAKAAGLRPVEANVERAELSSDGTLSYPAGARRGDRQRWVSELVARFLLQQQQRRDDSAASVARTAAALVLPREAFLRDAERTSWNLRELQQLYDRVSIGTLGLRMAMLHDASVTWFDRGRVRWRSVPTALGRELASPTRFEQNLAEIALETDTVLHPAPHVWAFPLNRKLGSVLVLCAAREVLERRD